MNIRKIYDKDRRCVVTFSGSLSVRSVKAVWLELVTFQGEYDQIVLDLKLVDDIDTAGFQLLTMLKKNAHRTQTRIKFINHSEPVLRLIELFGATGLFRDKIVIQKGPGTTSRFRYGVAPQEF